MIRRLLSVITVCASLSVQAWIPPSQVRCGRYGAKGVLHRSTDGHTVLEFFEGTVSAWRMPVTGVAPELAFRWSGLPVAVNLEVTSRGKKGLRGKILGKIRGIGAGEARRDPLHLIQLRPCP